MRPKYMRQVREAQEATRQKKLRDTPYGRDIDEGKTTAAQYKAAYGTVPHNMATKAGGNQKLKAINKRASMVSGKKAAEGVLSNKSASVIPDDETAKSIKAKRKTGTVYTAARFKKVKSKKTGKLGSDVVKNPEEFEAEYQASGTGKAGDTFEAMKTPSKKKKRKLPQSLRSAGKTGKRRARAKARERVIEKNETPGRTKETAKKIGKGIGKGIEKVKKVFKGKKKKPYIEKGRTKPRTKKQATAEEVINPDEFEAMYQASGKKKGK